MPVSARRVVRTPREACAPGHLLRGLRGGAAPAPSVTMGFVEEASYPPAHNQYPHDDVELYRVGVRRRPRPDGPVGRRHANRPVRRSAHRLLLDHYYAGKRCEGQSSGIIGGFAFFGFGFHSQSPSLITPNAGRRCLRMMLSSSLRLRLHENLRLHEVVEDDVRRGRYLDRRPIGSAHLFR
jgi:hypothetical protein